jgi:hypothetical protein
MDGADLETVLQSGQAASPDIIPLQPACKGTDRHSGFLMLVRAGLPR